MRFRITRTLMVATAILVVTGCGDGTTGAAGPSAEARPVPSEAYATMPDGSVPWVDEPITDQQLNGPPRTPRAPAPGSRPCRADQLTGVLTTWTRPGNGGETPRGFDAAIGKLIGQVEVRNTSPQECTLQGEVPTEMFEGGRRLDMLYTHGINAEARRRVTVVAPGARATLRLDWSGPFCDDIVGPLELAIALPDGGGTLRAPVLPTDTPNCGRGEGVNPNARGTLYASGFSEPVEISTPVATPLRALTVTVTGPSTAPAGERWTYTVELGNPTGRPIAL